MLAPSAPPDDGAYRAPGRRARSPALEARQEWTARPPLLAAAWRADGRLRPLAGPRPPGGSPAPALLRAGARDHAAWGPVAAQGSPGLPAGESASARPGR